MVFDAPYNGAFESGMRELDAPLPQHGHHTPVEYITHDPGEVGEVYLEEPPCPACQKGTLTREYNAHGQMLTCRNGCSQRFWLDAGEPLEQQQQGAPE